MTRLKKPSDPVKPSAPDPVDAWLDVLVAMLSIPKPDRQRVRDELEDHLRSRIDDLLIHGLTESQALQKAVAELGETADLARQLSHAHKPPRTRRYAMHALLIALTGTVVALGVNTMRPQVSTPAPVAVQSAAGAAALSGEPIPVRDQTLGQFLDSFKDQADRPLLVHWPMLARIGMLPETDLEIDTDPLPADVVFEMLIERQFSPRTLDDQFAVLIGPELIEIGLRSQFDQRTMERRVYSLSPIILPEDLSIRTQATQGRPGYQSWRGPEAVAAVLWTHVSPEDWTQNGGSLAKHSVVGETLVITAPLRMHEDLTKLLDQLRQERDAAFQKSLADASTRLAATRRQFAELDTEARGYTDRIAEIDGELSEITPNSGHGRDGAERISILRSEQSDLLQKLNAIRIRNLSLMTRADELELELNAVRAPSGDANPTRGAPTGDLSTPDVIHFYDTARRMQRLPYPAEGEMHLAELLAVQGFDADASSRLRIFVSRDNEQLFGDEGVPVRNVFQPHGRSIRLQPGDMVRVVERRLPAERMMTRPSR